VLSIFTLISATDQDRIFFRSEISSSGSRNLYPTPYISPQPVPRYWYSPILDGFSFYSLFTCLTPCTYKDEREVVQDYPVPLNRDQFWPKLFPIPLLFKIPVDT